MTKKEKGEELSNLLFEFEKHNENELQIIEDILIKGRDYNDTYKKPHMHPFMGTKIKVSNALLDQLEKIKILAA